MIYIKFTKRKTLELLKLKESGIPVTKLCKNQKSVEQHFITG